MKCEQELALLRETIRNERKDKRITQEELAEMLEVSPTHIKHIESDHRKPSIEILFEIAKILNISLDSVVFSKNESAHTDTREKIDRLLDISDEASLRFILVAFGVGMGLISTKASPFSCCTDKAMPIMAAKIERAAMSAALLVV